MANLDGTECQLQVVGRRVLSQMIERGLDRMSDGLLHIT